MFLPLTKYCLGDPTSRSIHSHCVNPLDVASVCAPPSPVHIHAPQHVTGLAQSSASLRWPWMECISSILWLWLWVKGVVPPEDGELNDTHNTKSENTGSSVRIATQHRAKRTQNQAAEANGDPGEDGDEDEDGDPKKISKVTARSENGQPGPVRSTNTIRHSCSAAGTPTSGVFPM